MSSSGVIVIPGNEDGTFGEPIISSITLISMSSFRAAVDFNHDGLLDIVIGDRYSGSVHVLLGNGNGTFHDIIFFVKDCLYTYDISVGNLNNDGFLDFAFSCLSPVSIHAVFANPNGTFTENVVFSMETFVLLTLVEIADFNGDNCGDILFYNYQDSGVYIFLGHGNGSFEKQKISFVRPFLSPMSLAVGDFNEDMIQDFFFTWMRDTTAGVDLAFGYNDGTFDVSIYFNLSNYILYALAVSDLNSDGHLDLVTVSIQPYTLSICFGDGNGNFEFYTILSSEFVSSNYYVAAADFNGDGYQDIFATSDLGPYIFLNTGQCDNASEIFETSTSIYN